MSSIEAVQFATWRFWHAVLDGGNVTACGRPVFRAVRMWHDWDEYQYGRCRVCARAVDRIHTGQHSWPEQGAGANDCPR